MFAPETGRGPRVGLAALLVCLLLAGCRGFLEAVLDLPEPTGTVVGPEGQGTVLVPAIEVDPTLRPPIEQTLDPDSALALLPRDGAGNVDWMEALREGVINPRSVLPGLPEIPQGFQPQFEVLFAGPDSTADAIFPHSPHVEWLACEQCHSPVQSTPVVPGYAMVTMTDVLQGELCGQCHGKVSFSPTGPIESCERCHPRLMPKREVFAPDAGADGPDGTGGTAATETDQGSEAPAGGRELYDTWCAMCHGDTGRGDGPLGRDLLPRPRDFTEAMYQVRTTASGELPTDPDLRRVIDEGIPGTAMPGWKNKLTVEERDSLTNFLKTLSNYFVGPPGDEIIANKPEAPPTAEDLVAGRAVFDEMQCFACHGDEGHGDGPSAATLTDDRGEPIKPANFTKGWNFNGGHRVEDIYMRLRTGMDGTPMPSLGDVLDAGMISETQLWQLAYYVRSLSIDRTPFGDVSIRMNRVTREASGEAGDSITFVTEDLPRALFPHWVHRIRFRCKVCHVGIFVPQAGANAVTMTDIIGGEFCGKCHNGSTAFAADITTCPRCHVDV